MNGAEYVEKQLNSLGIFRIPGERGNNDRGIAPTPHGPEEFSWEYLEYGQLALDIIEWVDATYKISDQEFFTWACGDVLHAIIEKYELEWTGSPEIYFEYEASQTKSGKIERFAPNLEAMEW